MRKTITALITLLYATSLLAVPAKHVRRWLTLSDGTRIEATLQGNEHLHYYLTDAGQAYVPQGKGIFVPADLTQLRSNLATLTKQANVQRRIRTQQHHRVANTGQKRGIVILVNYTDKKFTTEDPGTVYDHYFNEQGYTGSGMTGSVHDYFYDQSYGKLDIKFDVVGPVTLSRAMSYYGENDSNGNDLRPAAMALEAINLVDSLYPQIDFTNYDWDGDGLVDQVYIIYAGYSEAQGGEDETVWPHEWYLSAAGEQAPQPDGIFADKYACSSELRGKTGNTIDGIGTACHEFSHCLGLPDFYNTGSNGENPMGSWDLLDYGCYNNDGCTPTGYTSYERWSSGWMEPTEITGETTVTNMPALEKEGVAYILYNDECRDEYYLLENRQQVKWDVFNNADRHGLLVLHVDYSPDAWFINQVNTDEDHYRMTTISQNCYPDGRLDSLTNNSFPAATVYNANTDGSLYMNKPIEQIKESMGKISFVAMRGYIEVPVIEQPITEYTSNSFTAHWNAIEGATQYLLTLTEKKAQSDNPQESIMLTEDFATSCYSTSAMVSNIGTKMNNYTKTSSGWSGTYVYPSKYGLKMFSGGNLGTLTTPTLPVPDTNYLTLWFYAKPEVDDICILVVNFGSSMWGQIGFNTEGYHCISVPATKEMAITLKPQNNMYLGNFTIYDGKYEENQLEKAPRRVSTLQYETSENSYTFTNLNANSTYTVRVSAVSPEGQSNYSTGVSVCLADLTPVETVPIDEQHSLRYYDLSGRQVAHPTHGIYIRDGKKIIVK